MEKPTFKQGRDTAIILNLLSTIKERPNQFISWPELLSATNKRQRADVRQPLARAIIRARRDLGLVIENDRDRGYRLRPDSEMAESGNGHIRRARKRLRPALRK
jgi:DNA-binding winged helix-turn-helix (wHTH) protein